jgi:hypothetical protein
VADQPLGERLEMLLVMQWLDEGAPEDGLVALSVATAAAELGLEGGRDGLLAVMAALGELEERGLVDVAWPGGAGPTEARVTLRPALRTDAAALFGLS